MASSTTSFYAILRVFEIMSLVCVCCVISKVTILPPSDPKLQLINLEAEDVQRAMEKAGLTILEKETVVNPKGVD